VGCDVRRLIPQTTLSSRTGSPRRMRP
jgi:hypothetical protein